MEAPTLATKLGTTTHLSPLLHKASRLGLDAAKLEELAIQRGCDYYERNDSAAAPPVPVEEFSNLELALALLNPALRYHPQTLRLGAAMLGAPENVPEEIARCAELERCESVVRYIAEAGKKFEPENPFWIALLKLLPAVEPPKSSVMPHPTRFVSMTGFTRNGTETVAEWIRPIRRSPANG